jgi:hypothetical protein
MVPSIIYRVCYGVTNPPSEQVSHIKIQPAILHGYTRYRVKHCDYPAILATASSETNQQPSVRGTFVSGLSPSNIHHLDLFEGDEYDRRIVEVNLLESEGDEATGEGNVEGEMVKAETYVWIAGEHKLDLREWDFAEFKKEKMGRWTGDAEEYKGKPNDSLTEIWRIRLFKD